ncbi:MAG: ABC transporter permease, partial [Actinobacteria bacterium]|nr:ABC transporter permease [Actinomycetota bacterium]
MLTRLGAIAWRLVQAIPIAIGVTMLTFLLIHLIPGDPARTVLGSHATPSSIAALRDQWGLNKSLPAQYWQYLTHLLHGNLGQSLFYQRSIASVIGPFVLPTVWLIVYSAILSVLISVPVAAFAAIWRDRPFDHAVRIASQIGLGMPQPWVGLLLFLGFALGVRWFPVGGYGYGVTGHIAAMFLPSLTIAVGIAPILIRSLRAELIEVLASDYVTTARSKGLRESRVLVRHALRNASISAVTVLGLNTAWLVSGTVVVELVFGTPGMGSLLVNSFLRRDFPLVQGLAL